MKRTSRKRIAVIKYAEVIITCALILSAPKIFAQQPDGPQTSPPPAVGPVARSSIPRHSGTTERITVPAGTRLAVVLENGISTRDAKAGDSVYLRTSFPITQNNRIVIPIGSYVRGELLDSKRPGRVNGRGEFRMRLTTLIFPNGYTVDLLGAPRSADSGGNETMDSEGKVTGPGGKGKDAETIATTTATGAGIGAIASGGSALAARLDAGHCAGTRFIAGRRSASLYGRGPILAHHAATGARAVKLVSGIRESKLFQEFVALATSPKRMGLKRAQSCLTLCVVIHSRINCAVMGASKIPLRK
jgi:hypothetical protein